MTPTIEDVDFFDGRGKVEPRVSADAGGHISVAEREPPGTKMVDR